MSNNKIRKALQALKEIHPGNMTPMAEETWNKAIELLKAITDEPVEQEPFGYFRAEIFGFTDCSPDDKGSIALYEHPAPAVVHQLVEALEQLMSIVKIYSRATSNNFAWAEMDFAKEALAAAKEAGL